MTASAWIMHPHHEMVLLTHHRKLDKWLQLGGHADGCTNLLHVALQEASEESGIRHFDLLMTDIFDIDIHAIPARNNEPEHFHYDVRFLLRAHGEHYRVSEESHDLAWVSLESMRAYTNELSMLRMGDKCQRILRVSR